MWTIYYYFFNSISLLIILILLLDYQRCSGLVAADVDASAKTKFPWSSSRLTSVEKNSKNVHEHMKELMSLKILHQRNTQHIPNFIFMHESQWWSVSAELPVFCVLLLPVGAARLTSADVFCRQRLVAKLQRIWIRHFLLSTPREVSMQLS